MSKRERKASELESHCIQVINNIGRSRTDIMTLLSLKSLWRGQSAMRPMAVVQLGLAINLAPLVHSELISGTTKGMSLSYLNADYGWMGEE